MSKKTQTTSNSNQSTAFNFDPASLAAYHNNLATWLPTAQSFVSNPFSNPQFNFESTTGQDNAAKLGQRNMSNLTGNANAAGYGNNMPGFMAALQSAAQRGTSANQATAFRSAMSNAFQRQMQSMGLLSGFQPLMTGSSGQSSSNETQTTSGLGTWLPQLISAGLGAATMAFNPASASGGIGKAAGGAASNPFLTSSMPSTMGGGNWLNTSRFAGTN